MHDGTEAADERIRAVGVHRIQHHTPRPAAAERFHQHGRQTFHELRVQPCCRDSHADAVDQEIHRSRSPENGNGDQHGDEVGDDRHGSLETLFRAFDKGVVYVDFLADTADNESAYDGEKQNVGKQGGVEGDRLLAHHPEKQGQTTDERDHPAEEKQQVPLQDVDPLLDTDRQYGDQGRREGREHEGQEDISRVCRSHLCPVGHDGDRNQCQS